MSISTPFIRRPIATSLLTAAIFLAGLVAYPLLPVAPLPNVQFPTLTVTAQYPGASPETMASTVATPLETEFGQMLPGLSQMTSASVLGTTTITLQFGLSTDLGNAETLVLEAINAAQGSLPKGMPSPPTFRAINPADSPIMILAMQSDQAPITEVDNYAENLVEQQISQLPGVGQVLVGGQQTPAIRVQVDPAKLASMGLTLEDVRNVLTNVTVDDPKGSIDGPHQSFTIYANDQLTTAAPYNNVIIGYRNGGPIRIRDIGRAVAGPQNRELAAWTNGKPSILLLVFKQPNANVISTADGVQASLATLRADIPPNIHLNVVSDRTLTIRASVSDVEFTLMLSIGLVVMVIFLFLRNVLGDGDPQHHHPGRAGRHAGRDVPVRLQPRQSVADGADDRGGLRRRRRHRHAGEHLPPHRGRHETDAGGDPGRRRDRLHHRLDQFLADRGVHPAAVDGGHRRTPVPRVRDLRVDHHRGFRAGVADLDADDVRAVPELPSRTTTAASIISSNACSRA